MAEPLPIIQHEHEFHNEEHEDKPVVVESIVRPTDVRSIALTGLFILAVLYSLYFAKPVMLPVTIAVLLNFLLRPTIQRLEKIHIPAPLGAAVVMVVFFSALGGIAYGLSKPAGAWIARAPTVMHDVTQKLERLRQPMSKVTRVAAEVSKITDNAPGAKSTTTVQVHKSIIENPFIAGTREFFGQAVVILILLYFLLASGDFYLRRLIKVMPTLSDKKRALRIATEMQRDISRYAVTMTLINAGLGAALSLGLWAVGLPNPVLWGALGGLMNFIPYLGATINITLTTFVALLTFDSLAHVALVPLVYMAINSIEGSLITPWILGRRFTLNPVIIFVWLVFWGWMWGVPGALISVPMLAALKIFCDHIEGLNTLGEFFGGNGNGSENGETRHAAS